MNEYIERAAVLKVLEEYYPEADERLHIVKDITSIPTADVAEVVRCQNCKYRIYKDMGFDIGEVGGCQIWGVALPGDFYCAHGARMDKEAAHD